jgi:hypothetical protein
VAEQAADMVLMDLAKATTEGEEAMGGAGRMLSFRFRPCLEVENRSF